MPAALRRQISALHRGLNDPARKHIKTPGQFGGARQVVRSHHHRAPAPGHLAQHVIQHLAGVLIQTGVGFIQQQHMRVVQHGAPNRQALLHAAREGAHQVAPPGSQTDQIQHFADALFELLNGIHAPVKTQVFLGGQIAVQQRQVTTTPRRWRTAAA